MVVEFGFTLTDDPVANWPVVPQPFVNQYVVPIELFAVKVTVWPGHILFVFEEIEDGGWVWRGDEQEFGGYVQTGGVEYAFVASISAPVAFGPL